MRPLRLVPFLLIMAGTGLLLAAPPSLEIVSRLGRQDAVKIYSGEEVTFRVREAATGMDEIFATSTYLGGITFRLREWPVVDQNAHSIAKGGNRRVVFEKKPGPDLWGAPPSSLTLADREPGRYTLEATREGCRGARIILHFARFAITDITADLTEHRYTASFGLELADPDEDGGEIPVRIESLDGEGRIVDQRRDLALIPTTVCSWEYVLNGRVFLSSDVMETYMDRTARRRGAPPPAGSAGSHPLRVVEGGAVRISFRAVHAVYPLPLGAPN